MDYENFDVDEYSVKQIQVIISTLLLVLNNNQQKGEEIREIENIICYLCRNKFDNNSYEYKYNVYEKLDKKNKAKLDEINSKYNFFNMKHCINNVKNESLFEYIKTGYYIKDKKFTVGMFSKDYKDVNLKILEKIISGLIEKKQLKEENERESKRREEEARIRKENERRQREEEERRRIEEERRRIEEEKRRIEEERKRKEYLMKLERIANVQDVFSMSSSFLAYDTDEDETIESFNFKAYYPNDEDKYEILINKYNKMTLDCTISSYKSDNEIIIYLRNDNFSPDYKSEYEVLDDLDNFVIFNGVTNNNTDYFMQFKNLDLKSYKYLYVYLDSSGSTYTVKFKITFKFYNSDNKLPFETNIIFNQNNNKVNVENIVNTNANVVNTLDTRVINNVSASVTNTVHASITNTVHAKVTNLDSKYTTIF